MIVNAVIILSALISFYTWLSYRGRILCFFGFHRWRVKSWYGNGGSGTEYCTRCFKRGESDNTRV